MSAMSDLDHMLKEYESARAAMVSTAGTTILGHIQAAENVIRAADVLACGMRSMLTANAAQPSIPPEGFFPGEPGYTTVRGDEPGPVVVGEQHGEYPLAESCCCEPCVKRRRHRDDVHSDNVWAL